MALIIIVTTVECVYHTPVEQLFPLHEPLEIMLHFLKFVAGRQQVIVHDLGETLIDGVHRLSTKALAL